MNCIKAEVKLLCQKNVKTYTYVFYICDTWYRYHGQIII